MEVKDENDAGDIATAEAVFHGITIEGPRIDSFPDGDYLGRFDDRVADEATRRIDEASMTIPFSESIVGPGQEPGVDVPFLSHASGTRADWGGPDPRHSSYESMFVDADGRDLVGSNGTYALTTEPPPVDAFWSTTVYDTDRGGFLHPNPDNRYHHNGTTARPNPDGTVTFVFKQTCGADDVNCLAVPAGRFDVTARYYLARDPILDGEWTIPRPELRR